MIFTKLKFDFKIVVFLSVIILFSACKDAYDFSTNKLSTDTEINPKIAVPILDASITLEEVLPDDEELDRYLIIDDDNFMSISFETDLAEYNIDDFMSGAALSGPSLPEINYEIDPQVLVLGLNNALGEGNIHLANPSIKLLIKNYWDIPARFQFTDFYYYEEENSAALPLTGSLLTEWIEIDKPVAPAEFAIEEIVIDTNTTNIDEVLSALPHHLSFGAKFETIPGSPYSITAGTTNEVSVEVSIPLEFSLTNIQLTDTMDFNLGEDLDSETVKSIQINLLTDNGFPLGIDAQIYFVDEYYVVLDSLFDNSLAINPANVGTNGKVGTDDHVNDENIIKINSSKIENLLKAKFLIPKILFNTTNAANNQDVKLYSDYGIGLKMGALVELHFTTDQASN